MLGPDFEQLHERFARDIEKILVRVVACLALIADDAVLGQLGRVEREIVPFPSVTVISEEDTDARCTSRCSSDHAGTFEQQADGPQRGAASDSA